MLVRTITAGSLIGLLGLLAWPAASHAQCTAAEGSWSPIFDWENKINLASCGVGDRASSSSSLTLH
jgi:hypothetical protein